ncbi:MAG TPA: hypothetical protein PKY77_19355 [Phycisphaerae bacterium]|nr:hypothetical protein [Phycisphaerae bacterium]HRY68502.1 hypothetical protein [Phycisphaerae bacterium]HSA25550.1 hypothetical protein [Phycisphaerae bacterium]
MLRRLLLGIVLVTAASTAWGQTRPARNALPWHLPAITDPAMRSRGERIYRATERLAHHLLLEVKPWKEDARLMLLTESKSAEAFIRPNTGMVAGLAFLYRFGPYDEKTVGMSRPELLATRIVSMIRYLTETHVTGSRPTGDGRKWGDHWQSAHWTDMLALAAWWVGDDLPTDLAAAVRRVVAHEAERFPDATPPHQIRADTKAEENAWNSTVLSAAVLLMPDDPRRERWESAFQKWAFSSFLRPGDEHADAVVDGKSVAAQFTGANIYDDFTLENHRIVHPDYMTAFSLTLGCSMDYAMTGRRPPEALRYNVAGIYENLKWFSLPDGGFVYPSGQDWSIYRQVDWLYGNVLVGVFVRDPEAWAMADRGLDVLERMQARSPSGAVYLPEENFFLSGQTDKLNHFARAWLSLHFAEPVAPAEPQRWGVRRFDSAGMILNRTRSAVHAVSWGTRVMAQCVPLQTDRLISPHDRSGVGSIRLKGADSALPVSLSDVRVTNSKDAFAVELVVDHGKPGKAPIQAHLQFRSASEGTWTMSEKLVAATDCTTAEIATGQIGILNDRRWIDQRGERRVTLGDQSRTVAACSGELLCGDGIRHIDIDSVLRITMDKPADVRYAAASYPEQSRTTDRLCLNVFEGEHSWQAGQTISRFEATVRCEPR